MDPKANLKEQLELAREITAAWDNADEDGELGENEAAAVAEKANRLAELVLALDEWLRKGGFSPW